MLDPKFFRFYEKDWIKLPSVTTILQLLPEPEFVTRWKEKIWPEQYKIEMEGYGTRGTIIHKMCENHFLGANEPIPTDPELDKFVKGFHHFIMAFSPILSPVKDKYILEEELSSVDLGIAGRCDMICRVSWKVTLVDFKTSTSSKIGVEIRKKYSLQLAAYTKLWNTMEWQKNPIEQAMIVLLTDAKKTGFGQVETFSIEDLNYAWKDYVCLLLLFHMQYLNNSLNLSKLWL